MVSPGVGLLVARPRFYFGNAKAGGLSSVDFSLLLGESLVEGDRVEVVLGGFGGGAGVDNREELSTSTSVDVLVDGYSSEGFLQTNVSSNETATTVLIQVLASGLLTADAELQLSIPASAMLTIPLTGVRRDATGISLTVSTSATTTTMACDAAAIGAFTLSPRLTFAPPKADTPTEVTLAFSLASVELSEYEGVVLVQPQALTLNFKS